MRSFLKGFNRLDPGRIEKTLARGCLLLKRNADHATAVKLRQRIRINGATCVLEKQTGRQVSSGRMLELPSGDQDKRQDPAQAFMQRHLPAIKALQAKLILWRQWSQKPFNAFCNCSVLFLTALLLDVVLLFLGNYLWFIYTATTTGEHYVKAFRESATIISELLARDPVTLAWETVFLVLMVNLLVALILQFTHIARLYLDGGGLIIKLTWIVTSALGAAWLLSQRESMPPLIMALPLTLVPTACLLGGCLNLTRTLLPEMGTVFAELGRAVRHRENFATALKKIYRNWNNLKRGKKTGPCPMQGDVDV